LLDQFNPLSNSYHYSKYWIIHHSEENTARVSLGLYNRYKSLKSALDGRGQSTIPSHSIPSFHSTIPFHRFIPLNKAPGVLLLKQLLSDFFLHDIATQFLTSEGIHKTKERAILQLTMHSQVL
jgi:hypothetical protein